MSIDSRMESADEFYSFYGFVCEYPFFDKNGYMDLERVCCHLSLCFGADGRLEGSPQPRDMYNLLIEILDEYREYEKNARWVQHQKLVDWTPEYSNFYPDRVRTYIHPAGFVFAWEYWVFYLGVRLMNLSSPDCSPRYNFWIDDKLVYVNAFFKRLALQIQELHKSVDKGRLGDGGHSLFEALVFSKVKNIDYDDAASFLSAKSKELDSVISEVEIAISISSYIQAVSLVENFISDRLGSLLRYKNSNSKSMSLSLLIKTVLNKFKNEDTELLMLEVDAWRERRNNVIHGRLSSDDGAAVMSREDYAEHSKLAANDGLCICAKVSDWHFNEVHRIVAHKDSWY